MNFFGRYTNIPDFSESCRLNEKIEPWIRVEKSLPNGDRDVLTLIHKDKFDGTGRYVVEMQKFKPSNGWMNTSGVVAWKELDYEMLAMMKEKR